MNTKIVAIHQPNFFPWLGYFDKIAWSDVFIIMDNVQFSKKGGTYSNRVQLAINAKADWVTMPVVRSFHGNRRIDEMEINNTTPWREKLLKTVQTSYGRAPFFSAIFSLFEVMVNNQASQLAAYNESAIAALAAAVGLDTSKIVRGSTLQVEGAATDLLINMTRAVGGTSYLAGGSATSYQEDSKFETAGIQLRYQNFMHPVYPQANCTTFISGLSIIDALMNVGFDGVKAILRRTI